MPKEVRLRRGTTSSHSSFTGAQGEATVDTDKKVLVVHDGATVGGFPQARQSDVENVGIKTLESDGAISEQYALVKIGSTATRVAACGASDIPWGIALNTTSGAGESVRVAMLGSLSSLGRYAVAAGAISQGAFLEPAASGRVQAMGIGGGTHYIIGRAYEAAASAGEVIEIVPSYFLRVI